MHAISLRDRDFPRYELIGAIVVSILAIVFHFLFEWSGNSTFVGIFAAVNESVWEHTKIIYFPFLFFAVAEYFVLKPDLLRFLAAKAIALALIPLLMIIFFYTYSGMFGVEILVVDIIFTFILTFFAFYISCKVYMRANAAILQFPILILILFFGVLAIELLFTAFPPHIPLFQDAVTGAFGFPS